MRAPLMLALALTLSCGDKAEDGPATDSGLYGGDGADGTDGADGLDDTGGTDGTDGTDPGPLPSCRAADGLAANLGDVRISGDELLAELSYSGGCETHVFRLCWPDALFMESEPVQVNLEIIHDGPPDPCDAFPTEVVAFDLLPLKEAWMDAYGARSGTIIVNLQATSGSDSLRYDF